MKMNKLWNGRLYLEGIKKIRILGIAFSIIIVVINALIPLTSFLLKLTQKLSYSAIGPAQAADVISVETIPEAGFATSMFLLMFFTPFFFYTMFAYLNSRKESDFYHAIPYSRTSVYLAFTAAVFTWIFGILIVSVSLNTLLWFIHPYATFSWTVPLKIIAEYVVATLFVGGISAIAVCLTGTKASQFFVTMILLFFFRISMILFEVSAQHLAPVMDVEHSLLMLFSPKYYFPLSIIANYFDSSVLSNAVVWIYTSVLAVLSLVIGGVLYAKRRSETAEKSAPNRVFQHVFRCLFTLPFVSAIAALIVFQVEIAIIFVLANVTLVVYCLYELITSKSAKSLLKSLPFLGVLVAFALLFLGGVHVVKNVVLSQRYVPEQIESVGIHVQDSLDLFDTYPSTYESRKLTDVMLTDEQAKKIFCDALGRSIDSVKQRGRIYPAGNPYENGQEVNMIAKLASGRTVGKNVYMTNDEIAELTRLSLSSGVYADALIQIPEFNELTYIQCNVNEPGDLQPDMKTVYGHFRSDYEKLSREQKIEYKSSMTGRYAVPEGAAYSLMFMGSTGGKSFMTNYGIPAYFKETTAYLDGLKGDRDEKALALIADLAAGKIGGEDTSYTLNCQIFEGTAYILDNLPIESGVSSADYRDHVKEFAGMLMQHVDWSDRSEPDSPDDSSLRVRINVSADSVWTTLKGKVKTDGMTGEQYDRFMSLAKTIYKEYDDFYNMQWIVD